MSDMISDPMVITDDHVVSDDAPRLSCEVCGEPLHYSGRGRRPTRCAEHKRNKGTGTGTSRRGTANIQESMSQLYQLGGNALVLAGGAVGDPRLETDGELIASRADVLAAEWAKLAAVDPKVRKALEGLSTGSAWGGVVITHAMLLFAIARNHQANPGPERAPRTPRQRRQRDRKPAQMAPESTSRLTAVPSQPPSPEPAQNGRSPINIPDGLYPSE